MPLGLALITVKSLEGESKYKGILDCSYPKEFNLSRGLIQKIVNVINSPENVEGGAEDGSFELKYSDKIILVNVRSFRQLNEKELIILILSPEEVPNSADFYKLMLENIPEFYLFSKKDRVLQFVQFAQNFYQEADGRKLLIIGFPSAGKTCIKKAFFDGVEPQELLGQEAPEPTRGLAHFVYSWLDAEVGIVDSSGQEFESYVSPENDFERSIAFEESDIIIYVFDVMNWQNEQDQVLDNMEKIMYTKNSLSGKAKIYAFCHKIDLLQGSNQEKANSFLKIKEIMEERFGIKTIFTSLQPELIHTLFRSMQIILNELSQLGNSIEDFCADVIRDQTKSAIFLLNDNNNVISQKSTSDLSLDDVSKIIELVKNQRRLLKDSPEFGDLDYSVVHTTSNMALIVKNVNIIKYGVSTVAFLSHNVTRDTLSTIVSKLDQRLTFESRTHKAINDKKASFN